MRLLIVSVLLIACSLYAGNWQIQTLDSDGVTGYWTSIRTDSFDKIHIVYRNDTANQLVHIFQDGSGWSSEVIATAECCVINMVLDSNDMPCVSYWDYSTAEISCASWNGSTWTVSALETATASAYHYPQTDIEIDSAGYPHIAWYDGSASRLRYGSWNGSVWNIVTVDSTGTTGINPSLELDSSDHPHISYCNSTDNTLNYAFHNGTDWELQVVDSSSIVSGYTSIALDGDENPHISYYCSWHPADFIKYAWWNGSSWIIEVVNCLDWSYPGSPQGLALDSQGNAHISGQLSEFGNYLLYFYRSTGGWTSEYVDSDYTGVSNSICVDAEDNPHIAYFDINNEDLLYAAKEGVVVFTENSTRLQSFDFSISPNPASIAPSVNITTGLPSVFEVSVFDLSGREVISTKEINVAESSSAMLLDGLMPGIYFCTVSKEDVQLSRKFVILE